MCSMNHCICSFYFTYLYDIKYAARLFVVLLLRNCLSCVIIYFCCHSLVKCHDGNVCASMVMSCAESSLYELLLNVIEQYITFRVDYGE